MQSVALWLVSRTCLCFPVMLILSGIFQTTTTNYSKESKETEGEQLMPDHKPNDNDYMPIFSSVKQQERNFFVFGRFNSKKLICIYLQCTLSPPFGGSIFFDSVCDCKGFFADCNKKKLKLWQFRCEIMQYLAHNL